MRAAVLLLTACAGVAGCGTASGPQQATQSGPPAPLVAMPAGAEDVVVARVNDRPVYGSCLKAQAARGATKQQALDQCIDFELLAQQSTAFATDGDVVHETRAALVSTLIAHDYEDKFNRPTDFGAYWDRSIEKNRQRIEHGEARASAYVRFPLSAKTATPGEDAAAHALANEVAAAVAGERGLMAPHLAQIAERVVAGRAKLEHASVPPYLNNGGLVDDYAKPLFGITDVGRTWPTAVRTGWGWDVILLTELIPAEKLSPQEILVKILPEVKRSYFPLWATQVGQRLGVALKIYDDNVPLLENVE